MNVSTLQRFHHPKCLIAHFFQCELAVYATERENADLYIRYLTGSGPYR